MCWRIGAIVFAALGVLVACGGKTYDVTFTCTEHPDTKVDVGRPLGCEVGLSYGNPYYGDDQQTCNCQINMPGAKPGWTCPI